MLDAFTAILRAFPDGHSEIEKTFEDGEWVIIEWRFGGTMRGEFSGHAPTGRSLTLHGCEFFRVTDGKIRFQRGYWDRATWFKQLGLPQGSMTPMGIHAWLPSPIGESARQEHCRGTSA